MTCSPISSAVPDEGVALRTLPVILEALRAEQTLYRRRLLLAGRQL
jgi:hypothetical protein